MVQTKPIRDLVTALDNPDPLLALRASAALQREADLRTEILVRQARVAGCTWAEVAAALGVSRQAVHKRYGR